MNKLMIVLLAVCLVASTQAFVKRDAPATPTTAEVQAQFEAFQKQIQELSKTVVDKVTEAGGQAANAINPEEIKKNINDFVNAVTKSLENLKPAAGAQPAAA